MRELTLLETGYLTGGLLLSLVLPLLMSFYSSRDATVTRFCRKIVWTGQILLAMAGLVVLVSPLLGPYAAGFGLGKLPHLHRRAAPAISSHTAQFMNEQHQDTVVIKPRIWPRDFMDVCVGLPIGLFLGVLLCVVPALATFFTSRAFGVSGDTSFIAAFVACCLFYGFYLLFMVRRLTIGSDGLHFHRVLGSPKFLAWNRISTIVIASRSEVVVRGWLWPPFPSREMTASLTALRHYRISWDGGDCYYPPAQIEDFERRVVSRIQARDT